MSDLLCRFVFLRLSTLSRLSCWRFGIYGNKLVLQHGKLDTQDEGSTTSSTKQQRQQDSSTRVVFSRTTVVCTILRPKIDVHGAVATDAAAALWTVSASSTDLAAGAYSCFACLEFNTRPGEDGALCCHRGPITYGQNLTRLAATIAAASLRHCHRSAAGGGNRSAGAPGS